MQATPAPADRSGGSGAAARAHPAGFQLLRAAGLLATFDRFTAVPLLVTIAAAMNAPLSAAVAAVAAHHLLYGAMQPLWGVLSDRFGRVRVIRLALLGMALGGSLSALAPDLMTLVAARGVTGAFGGALISTALVYVGDSVPLAFRERTLAALMAATGAGTAAGMLVPGLTASFASWRVGFAIPALAAVVLAVAFARLPEPPMQGRRLGLRARLGVILRRWPLLVMFLAFVEGGVVYGVVTFFAPALEATGHTPAEAGLIVATFGISLFFWTYAVRHAATRLGGRRRSAIAGLLLAAGYATAAGSQASVAIASGTIMIAGGLAFIHMQLQAWATEVAPGARALMISFFAAALFTGSAAATLAGGPAADAREFGPLFGGTAVIAILLSMAVAIGRQRYVRANRAGTPSSPSEPRRREALLDDVELLGRGR